MTAEAYQWKNTLRRFTNGDFFQTLDQQWALSPGASAATLCQVLPRQRLDLFAILSSLRNSAECLYYDVSLPPILPVLSCLSSHRSYTVHTNHTSYIHTFMHSYIHAFIQSYIHTLILSHIHTLMHAQHIHGIIHT
jgi:hypothetical protein